MSCGSCLCVVILFIFVLHFGLVWLFVGFVVWICDWGVFRGVELFLDAFAYLGSYGLLCCVVQTLHMYIYATQNQRILIKKSDKNERKMGMTWAFVPLHPLFVGCKTHN